MTTNTVIYSIFGQIERVAAEMMIARHTAEKIEPQNIPETALYDDNGQAASFAIILRGPNIRAYDELCADLRM